MTRSEIIADHIATLRNLASNSDATRARMVFAHAIYAALATPGCEAQGARLSDLPHLAERVAEMADAHERVVWERDAARTLLNLVSEALSGGEAPADRLPELVFAMGQRFAAAVDARDAARAEVATLRARLVEGKEHAERERVDVVAELRRLYAAQRSKETPVAATLDILIGLFESGKHEGAATPK